MAINKKLIHFNTKAEFEKRLSNNEILDTSIVFIKDAKEIYTHKQIYQCDLSEYVTKDELPSIEYNSEDEKLIIITIGETFELNDFLWV